MSPDGKGRLLLVRHTESVWNKLNVFTGWVDVELSEAGKIHAKEVGESMKGKFQVDTGYTSGLIRAQQTLDLVMEGAGISGIPIVKDWHLNERFYGNWQGKNKKQMAEKYGEEAIHAVRRGYAARPPGGESLEDTTERVMEYFDEVIEPELAEGQNPAYRRARQLPPRPDQKTGKPERNGSPERRNRQRRTARLPLRRRRSHTHASKPAQSV